MVVLLVGAIAFKDRIAEEYWLWKLESEYREEQEVAAERLEELRSVRAIPGLLKLCAANPVIRRSIAQTDLRGRADPPRRGIDIARWVKTGQPARPLHSCDDRFLEALSRIIRSRRQDSVHLLGKAFQGDNERIRRRAAVLLAELGPDAAPALPVLESVLQEKPDDAIAFAVEQIKQHLLKDDKTGPPSRRRSPEEDPRP
jgi:hypothetical protein